MKKLLLILASASMANLSEFGAQQLLLPPAPATTSQAYIIMDAKTGAVIAEKNSEQQMAPASLTKLMTCYVMFSALKQGQLSLDDDVHISTHAWQVEGSRMFLNEHSKVPLQNLLKGVIITSANDASVALSEHFAGSDLNFTHIMNRYASQLQMNDSHFVTVTGLDDEKHLTTAKDLAILSQHVINDFPEYFHWFHEKSISHNGITQNNRHNLMFNHPEIDGLKTGHTSVAGNCLATTAQKDNTRLIIITLNAPSSKARDQDTLALLNFGLRFYETTLLYPRNTTISNTPVYLGLLNNTNLVTHDPFWATIPKGSLKNIEIDIELDGPISAPVSTQNSVGQLRAMLEGKVIATLPLYPENDIQNSSGISLLYSKIKLFFKTWLT